MREEPKGQSNQAISLDIILMYVWNALNSRYQTLMDERHISALGPLVFGPVLHGKDSARSAQGGLAHLSVLQGFG